MGACKLGTTRTHSTHSRKPHDIHRMQGAADCRRLSQCHCTQSASFCVPNTQRKGSESRAVSFQESVNDYPAPSLSLTSFLALWPLWHSSHLPCGATHATGIKPLSLSQSWGVKAIELAVRRLHLSCLSLTREQQGSRVLALLCWHLSDEQSNRLSSLRQVLTTHLN